MAVITETGLEEVRTFDQLEQNLCEVRKELKDVKEMMQRDRAQNHLVKRELDRVWHALMVSRSFEGNPITRSSDTRQKKTPAITLTPPMDPEASTATVAPLTTSASPTMLAPPTPVSRLTKKRVQIEKNKQKQASMDLTSSAEQIGNSVDDIALQQNHARTTPSMGGKEPAKSLGKSLSEPPLQQEHENSVQPPNGSWKQVAILDALGERLEKLSKGKPLKKHRSPVISITPADKKRKSQDGESPRNEAFQEDDSVQPHLIGQAPENLLSDMTQRLDISSARGLRCSKSKNVGRRLAIRSPEALF